MLKKYFFQWIITVIIMVAIWLYISDGHCLIATEKVGRYFATMEVRRQSKCKVVGFTQFSCCGNKFYSH